MTRLSYFRQLVVNGGTKYIPKTRYLISWWSPFPQKHSSNCLKPWSANFQFISWNVKVRKRNEVANTTHSIATCCRYNCGGELEIILEVTTSYTTSIVMYSEKTARYAIYHMGGKLSLRHLKQCSSRMVLYMNVSARGGWLEPEVLWIRRDQAAAPVNLPKVLRNTSYILFILLDTSSSYFDLSIILHLKFCCIFMACCILMAK